MAIDPPYRLDPFRSIINVKWTTEQPPKFQIFLWLRWEGANFNGRSGNWFPVSDGWWAAQVAAGRASGPPGFNQSCAFRTNLSDLIEAGQTNSNLYAPGFPPPEYDFHFSSVWESYNESTAAWPRTQPTTDANGSTDNVYRGIIGTYINDDMGTASGHFWPDWPAEVPPLP